jgi:hypothetical protein
LPVIFCLLLTGYSRAQVTIGANIDPNEGSLLDLKTSDESVNSTKGMMLPRVQLTDFNKLYPMLNDDYDPAENAKHVGLTVYPIDVHGCNAWLPGGIYVWDGAKWEGLYPVDDVTKYVDIEVDEDGAGPLVGKTTLRFLTYNLGANPGLTPKQQMAYDTQGDASDITVFGGLYQWGRKDAEHSLRCAMAGHSGSFTPDQYDTAADAAAGGQFVYGSSNDDWLSDQTDYLWGNGGGLATQTNTTYSDPQNVNNPCPSGYRVPTQYEWALLGHKENGPDNPWSDYFDAYGSNSTSSGLGLIPDGNPGIVWVPVSEGTASTSWSGGKTCGYALYTFGEWDGAALGYKTGNDPLIDAGAPEPLLFLPAGGIRSYSDGIVGYTGSYGYYWSSVVDGTYSYYMTFGSSNVYAGDSYYRANGQSVRCIAE